MPVKSGDIKNRDIDDAWAVASNNQPSSKKKSIPKDRGSDIDNAWTSALKKNDSSDTVSSPDDLPVTPLDKSAKKKGIKINIFALCL